MSKFIVRLNGLITAPEIVVEAGSLHEAVTRDITVTTPPAPRHIEVDPEWSFLDTVTSEHPEGGPYTLTPYTRCEYEVSDRVFDDEDSAFDYGVHLVDVDDNGALELPQAWQDAGFGVHGWGDNIEVLPAP